MEHLWAVVLAGGDGTRVAALTLDEAGRPVPKQYCTFGTGEPMLRWAIRRASAIVPLSRVVVVVAEAHRPLWLPLVAELPPENVVVQPRARGTAAGILLPTLDVFLRRDRDASFLVLPADHHVASESVLRDALLAACRTSRAPGSPLTLVGVAPEDEDPDFGWLVPRGGLASRLRRVACFVEKPDAATHRRLLEAGALVSSFMFAARGRTLLGLFEDAQPELLQRFTPVVLAGRQTQATAELYERIPVRDFCRHVLERCVASLGVVSVSACGWSDLGTPERLRSFLARRRQLPRRPHPALPARQQPVTAA